MRKIVRFVLALNLVVLVSVAASRAQEVQKSPPTKAVTFADVMQHVRAGKAPGEILENCDVIFTLTPEQREELLKAGASKSLVDALQVKRITIGDVTDFVIILDCSGSMKDQIGPGETKMDAAKRVVGELFKVIPNGRNLSFIIYGHDAALECRAVKVVRPLEAVDDAARQELVSAVAALRPVGHTPIAASLRAAGQVLAMSGGMSQVVLITDGIETCKGDPASEAEKLVATVKGLRAVEVIGVGLAKPEEKAAVAQIARRGRGKYFDVTSAPELVKALEKSFNVGIDADPPKDAPKAEPPAGEFSTRVKVFLRQLNDKDEDVRGEAAKGLMKEKNKAKPIVDALMDALASDKARAFTRNQIACQDSILDAIRSLAPDQVVESLGKAAEAKDADVRKWALIRLADPDGKAKKGAKTAKAPAIPGNMTPKLKVFLKQLDDEEENVRGAAAKGLMKENNKSKEIIAALIQAMSSDRAKAFTREQIACQDAMLAAIKALAPEQVDDALGKAAEAKDADVRKWALARLSKE